MWPPQIFFFAIKYTRRVLFRRNPDIIESSQQDEVMLLNPESGQYLSLEDVGAFIWRLLGDTEEVSLGQVVAAVCQTYAVDGGTAKRDVETFVEVMVQNGLLLKQ